MEMNENIQRRYADKILKAMTDEKLLTKNVAETLETDAASMSHLKNLKSPKDFKRISERVWENIRQWYYSGGLLAEFKLKADESKSLMDLQPEQPELTVEEMAFVKTDGSKFENVSGTPYPEKLKPGRKPKIDKKPKDKEAKRLKAIARGVIAQIRKGYESEHHPFTLKDGTKVEIKGGEKIDLSQIDIRTGTVITLEVYTDHTTITIDRR